ncbi:MAG: hypothetical protein NTY01_03370 [Verrucomicrobia bacterium]|nr:hypothetical protein [Verrucomicrobiota bacterium]
MQLLGASIGGDLDCHNGQFSNPDKDALTADGVKVIGGVILSDGFKAQGAVRLLRASIGGNLDCHKGQFSNPGKDALTADGVKVIGRVTLSDGFKAEGAVRLLGASIGGNLDCINGQFSNPGKDAISADGLKVEGGVFFRDGFKAEGEVRLLGASIGRNLDCINAQFSNPGKDAISADGLKVEGGVFFRDGFKAEGRISLVAAEIGGHLQWMGVQSPKTATLDLRSAKVKTFLDEQTSWPPKGQLYLQGFVYEQLDHQAPASAEDRIEWLGRQDEGFGDLPATANRAEKRAFFAQPYEQLASVLRKSGLEDDADEILIEKNKRVAQWTRFWSLRGLWYRVIGPPIRYGYRPMIMFWWSLAVIIYGCYLFGLGNANGLITPTHKDAYVERNGKTTKDIREDYPRFSCFVYSTEMFVPLVNLFQKEYWLPNANRGPVIFPRGCVKLTSGGALRIYLWVHIALGWTLTTIWVAGLTGVIKKRG